MTITHTFTATLPAPSSTITDGFVFVLSTAWFTDANQGPAGSPIDGGVNSIANGGGDMMAFSDTACTNRLPIHVVTFVAGGSPDALVYVRTPTYESGDTITIGRDDTQTTQPLPNAIYGQYNVWQDCKFASDNGLSDWTGNSTPIVTGSPTQVTDRYGNPSGATLFDDTTEHSEYITISTGSLVNTVTLIAQAKIGTTDQTRLIGVGNSASASDQINIRTNFASSVAVEANVNFTSGTKAVIATDGSNDTLNTWRDYAVIVDSETQQRCYINQDSNTGDAVLDVSGLNQLRIGTSADATPFGRYPITVAYTRLYESAKSDAFIKATQLNQSDPDNFATIGEYAVFGGGAQSATLYYNLLMG